MEYVVWFFRLDEMKQKGVFNLLMLHAWGRGIRKWSMEIPYYYLKDFYFSGPVRFYDWHISENALLKHEVYNDFSLRYLSHFSSCSAFILTQTEA